MYELILDEIEARSLADASLSELAQIANTTGRLGGLAVDSDRPEAVTIRIVRTDPGHYARLTEPESAGPTESL